MKNNQQKSPELSFRYPEIPGISIFAGTDEVLKISHSAHSKTVFAVGALNAAVFIVGKKPGMYNMSDLLAEK